MYNLQDFYHKSSARILVYYLLMKSILVSALLSVASVQAIAQSDSAWGIVKNGVQLDEITVNADKSKNQIQMKLPQNIIKIDNSYIEGNFSGSLMQSLSQIPGVKAITIGSGQSKPVIRGLGFNRMAVCENGIKHQGQQWGHEHGLEIDQFSVESIEIIKGPAALIYGSDAIGGVININNNTLPAKRIECKAKLFARSNNRTIGSSMHLGGLIGDVFYKINATYAKYSDYIVPVDYIQYYSYYIRLKDNRLRNTAGEEKSASVAVGINKKHLKSQLTISDNYAKCGFFANAHGIEIRLSKIDFDRSYSDIDYPYNTSNHLKIINNNSVKIGYNSLNIDLAFQNNLRREYSEPVSHGYMPKPDSFLEREFDKKTYSANLQYRVMHNKHTFCIGANTEFQNNETGGWGYILPRFKSRESGVYVQDKYFVSNDLIIRAGIRLSEMHTFIYKYRDWFRSPQTNGDWDYALRSDNLEKHWNSLIYSAGINWLKGNWVIKSNIGKSFRMPLPSELGADGVNYQIFRYEKGNPDLNPEEAYQADLGLDFQKGWFEMRFDPFLNYFPNYIYLNPDFTYNEGLQLYNYVQNKVLRYGAEFESSATLFSRLKVTLEGECLYSKQLSGNKKGFSLPFSPPCCASLSAKYLFPQKHRVNQLYVTVAYNVTAAQNEIVPPEKATDGHQTVNAVCGKAFVLKHLKIKTEISVQNLFNSTYFDHTSYYRLIDVPEPGRNVSIMASVEF